MFYAILFNMDSPRSLWPGWLDSLRQKGLNRWVAWFLDAAGPFNLLGAQLIYVASPIFFRDAVRAQAFASLLEDESETQAFVAFLREQT
jgi:hypothetical protein